jgi:hypothetical protein
MPLSEKQHSDIRDTQSNIWDTVATVADVLVPLLVKQGDQIDALVPDTNSDIIPPDLEVTATSTPVSITMRYITNELSWFVTEVHSPSTGTWELLEEGDPTDLKQEYRFVYDGLTPLTNYTFQIKATDASGNKTLEQHTFQTGNLVGDVEPPEVNTVAIPAQTSVMLKVSTNEPTSIVVDEFHNGTWVQVGESTLDKLEHEIHVGSLIAGTLYQFRVTATDFAGNETIDMETFTTLISGGQQMARSISWGHFTWYWAEERPVGQFACGSPWVHGPITLLKVTPTSVHGVKNGSMIDPVAASRGQGFGAMVDNGGYQAGLNIETKLPMVIAEGSIVSSKYPDTPYRQRRPELQAVGVLTVLKSQPAPNALRPGYVSGADKTPKFTSADIQLSRLPKITPTAKMPKPEGWENTVNKPWVDFIPNWTGLPARAFESFGNPYGRDMTARYGDAALIACRSDISPEQQLKIAIGLVQVGIDYFQHAKNAISAFSWVNNGGHASGRLFPIVLAAELLQDPEMMAFRENFPEIHFGELDQTFEVQQSDVGRPLNPDPRATKQLYVQGDVGKKEWGILHATDITKDNANIRATYRDCCTGNCWMPQALIVRKMGIMERYGDGGDDFFGYVDRYLKIGGEFRGKMPSNFSFWRSWWSEVWDAER